MTNRPRSHVLYTGITGDLPHRVFQHKNRLFPSFTSRYNLTRLVYYEEFVYPDGAINREKWLRITPESLQFSGGESPPFGG